MSKWIGYDGDGHPRVWGDGDTDREAKDQAHQAAREYVSRRPDTGPIQTWLFLDAQYGWADQRLAHRIST